MSIPSITKLPTPIPSKTGWPWTETSPMIPEINPDSSTWPRISIVTPSYNQGQFIEETIRSVLLQDYPNLEYIIIDGGSTDNSVEIIKRYEPWLTFWISEKDRGQSHAINKGWQHGTGELFAWLNSDDYLEPGVLGRVASYYKQGENSSLGMIYGRSKIIDQDRDYLFSIGESFELSRPLIDLIDPFPQPSVFITKKAIDRTGFLDESMHYAMDLDLFIRIALSFPIFFTDEIWSTVRFSPDTKTSKNPNGFMSDQISILKKLDKIQVGHDSFSKIKKQAYASVFIRSARFDLRSGYYLRVIKDIIQAFGKEPFFTLNEIIKKFELPKFKIKKT